MISFILAIVMTYMSAQQFFTIQDATLTAYSLIICNSVCAISLLVVAGYRFYLERALAKTPASDEEDDVLNALERKVYYGTFFYMVALVGSFVVLMVGFILVRNTFPEIAGVTVLLLLITCVSFSTGPRASELVFPNYEQWLKKPANRVEDTLSYYDDGQKHVMLKTLYRLYFMSIVALVLLMGALMFYSVFSGVNQTVSIIGIGMVLFGLLVTFGMCLRPKKVVQ